MQGVPRTLPDCSNQASLAEVSQFRTKKEYCSQSRPTGTSLSTLAGNFTPPVQGWDRFLPIAMTEVFDGCQRGVRV